MDLPNSLAVALALLPLLWSLAGIGVQRWRFAKLMYRELEELGPEPENVLTPVPGEFTAAPWRRHLPPRRFLHREILRDSTANRDFISSLSPDRLYAITQLWNSFDAGDSAQFKYFIHQVADGTPVRFIVRKEAPPGFEAVVGTNRIGRGDSGKDHVP